jgi:hypothetical protein
VRIEKQSTGRTDVGQDQDGLRLAQSTDMGHERTDYREVAAAVCVAEFRNSDSDRHRVAAAYEYNAQAGRAWAFWSKFFSGPDNDHEFFYC